MGQIDELHCTGIFRSPITMSDTISRRTHLPREGSHVCTPGCKEAAFTARGVHSNNDHKVDST